MSDVVFDAEVVSHFIHADMPAHEVDALLRPLRITVVPVDKALAHLAGRLPGVTAGARGSASATASASHWHGATGYPPGPTIRVGRRSPTPPGSRW